MKKIFLIFMLISMFAIANLQAALNVPITVKEPSGFDVSNYPVTAMVPLPYGEYYNTDKFRLVDTSGVEVAAQFNPIMHHILRDNSLKFVQVIFLADLDASSSTIFTIKDDVPAAKISNPISVLETTNDVTINTGKIEIKLRKNTFNLFDEVKLISTGESLISSTDNQGPIFKGLDTVGTNGFYESYFSARTINKFKIEESGPIRTIIRVESFTESHGYTNQEVGFISRIYAYRNSDVIKVDMALVNGEEDTFGYPIYYYDFSIKFPLNLTSPSVKFGTENGTYSGDAVNGKKIIQWDTHDYKITESDGSSIQNGTTGARGWMNVADNNSGIYSSIRNFWQTYPNGFEYDADGNMLVKLWPEGRHEQAYGNNWSVDSSDLYWLDDMVGIRKEILFKFHNGNMTESEMTSLDRNFQWHPVASVPYTWHQSCGVTSDFGGALPNLTIEIVPSNDTLDYGTLDKYHDSFDKSTGRYMFGWNNYFGDPERRRPCNAGAVPSSYNAFLINGASSHFFKNEIYAMADVNLRKVWTQNWAYDTHQKHSSLGILTYCGSTWRSTAYEAYRRVFPEYLDSTKQIFWNARDYPHLWTYHLEEYYNASGDLWVKDLMSTWLEFFKATGRNNMLGGEVGDTNLRMVTRGAGHALGNYLMAMRIADNPNYLEEAHLYIDKIANVQKSNKYGLLDPHHESPFQLEFLDRSLASFMQMVEGYDVNYWQKAFGIVYGTVEFNTNYMNFEYYWEPEQVEIYGEDMYMSDTIRANSGNAFIDLAAWFEKECGYYANREMLSKAWDGYNLWVPTMEWNGGWHGRQAVDYYDRYYNVADRDTVPPVKISSIITAKPLDNGLELSFNVPDGDVAKYHVRWDFTPIKEGPDPLAVDSVLWWMAKSGGVYSTAKSAGETETITMYLPLMDTSIYVTIKSFDAVNNMSIMSENIHVKINITAGSSDAGETIIDGNISAYPNPFNPSINITLGNKFTKSSSMPVVNIYNTSGRLVESFEYKIGGIKWNASNMSSGIYIVKAYDVNAKIKYSKKITLMK